MKLRADSDQLICIDCLQAYDNDERVNLTVTLPLAERLIKKFIDENKIEAEAEVNLYLMVLEKEVFK